MNSQKLVLGIPKGSLQEYTLKIFQEASFNIDVPERGYHVTIDDPEIDCFLLRPQEIPRYAAAGKLDLGISGDDWIASPLAWKNPQKREKIKNISRTIVPVLYFSKLRYFLEYSGVVHLEIEFRKSEFDTMGQ